MNTPDAPHRTDAVRSLCSCDLVLQAGPTANGTFHCYFTRRANANLKQVKWDKMNQSSQLPKLSSLGLAPCLPCALIPGCSARHPSPPALSANPRPHVALFPLQDGRPVTNQEELLAERRRVTKQLQWTVRTSVLLRKSGDGRHLQSARGERVRKPRAGTHGIAPTLSHLWPHTLQATGDPRGGGKPPLLPERVTTSRPRARQRHPTSF